LHIHINLFKLTKLKKNTIEKKQYKKKKKKVMFAFTNLNKFAYKNKLNIKFIIFTDKNKNTIFNKFKTSKKYLKIRKYKPSSIIKQFYKTNLNKYKYKLYRLILPKFLYNNKHKTNQKMFKFSRKFHHYFY
jgi:hypothetical protein